MCLSVFLAFFKDSLVSDKHQSRMLSRRVIAGLISLALLVVGGFLVLTRGYEDETAFFSGVCVKVGLVLGAACLAWPTVEKLGSRLPTIVNVAVLSCVVLVAVRPRLMPLIVGLVVAIIVVHFGLRLASGPLRKE